VVHARGVLDFAATEQLLAKLTAIRTLWDGSGEMDAVKWMLRDGCCEMDAVRWMR